MKTKLILMLVFVSGLSCLTAQNDSLRPIQKLNACEVNVLFGGYFQPIQYGTIAEFKKLAPGSELLKADFTAYNQFNDYVSSINSMFSVNLGFRFGNSSKSAYRKNPLLRLGFSYFSTTDLANNLGQTTTFRNDTLVSSGTGQVYYIDSTIYRSYNMQHTSDQLRLDVSLVYRTDPKARWQFYAGLGLTAGASLKSYTTVNYMVSGSLVSTDYYLYPVSSEQNYEYKNEYFRNSADIGMSAYVPLGLDFRLGKKRPFWKRTHLFYEARPGASFSNIGDLGFFANISVQQGLGIKVNWE
jgi:hypothetical protein